MELLRSERVALEKHARMAGCKLIVNYGLDYDKTWSTGTKNTRLQILIEFLESMSDENVEVALVKKHRPQSLTILGDWFMAESFAGHMSEGYRQTLFTGHAVSVQRRLEEFDREFDELLTASGIDHISSRSTAIAVLTRELT